MAIGFVWHRERGSRLAISRPEGAARHAQRENQRCRNYFAASALDAELDKLLADDRAVSTQLSTVLGVTDTADRVPPARAYAIEQQAAQALASFKARWQALQKTKADGLDSQVRLINKLALTR